MIDFIEKVDDIGTATVLILFVLAFIAIKFLVDAGKWVRDVMESWRTRTNEQEERDKKIQEKLTVLWDHDKEQAEAISDLANVVNMMRSELKEMRDAQEEQRLKDRFDSARKTILSGANRLKNANVLTSDMYKEIYEAYDEYVLLVEKHGFKNGRIEASMKLVNDHYITDSILDDEE